MRARDPQFQRRCLIYGGLALATLAVYLPVLYHGFVQYDDQQYVTDNPRVQAGLTWHGLVWAFGFYAGNWHPLTWLSHMLDCQIYGAWAGGHHLTNVFLHIASTLLLFSVLNRMTNAMWRSAAVAALFAWHPLHVESVAWVAERKDVLCAFFWMLTLWFYARYAQGRSRVQNPAHDPPFPISNYLLALFSFVLCLMSKPMGVTLPFVLLLLDYWPLKRMANFKKLLLEKIPFLALSAAACVLTLRAQQPAMASTAGLPVSGRIANAVIAFNDYLAAMFVPRHLAVYYPYQFHPPAWTVACAAIVLGLVTLFAIKYFRARPWLITGWLWFLGTLVPVIGLVQVGDQARADRYTYIPFIGLSVMVVWLACEIIRSRVALQCAFVVVAVALLALTSRQLGYWQNTRTLFEHANQVTQRNALAITMLGSLLDNDGKLNKAMEYYQTALRYSPTFPEAHFFLGNALEEQGKPDEAIAEYQKALWFRPMQEQTHIFMAIALAKQKKYDEAIAHYKEALKLNPDSAPAHSNLARIYQTQGRFDDAIAHYVAALEIDPKLSIAHNNLGILLLQKGKSGRRHQAIARGGEAPAQQCGVAIQSCPGPQPAGPVERSRRTVPKDGGQLFANPRAHCEYAVALAHLKQSREAMSEYAAAPC